jgi:hypothetical protein
MGDICLAPGNSLPGGPVSSSNLPSGVCAEEESQGVVLRLVTVPRLSQGLFLPPMWVDLGWIISSVLTCKWKSISCLVVQACPTLQILITFKQTLPQTWSRHQLDIDSLAAGLCMIITLGRLQRAALSGKEGRLILNNLLETPFEHKIRSQLRRPRWKRFIRADTFTCHFPGPHFCLITQILLGEEVCWGWGDFFMPCSEFAARKVEPHGLIW